jgi:hypothetical protein
MGTAAVQGRGGWQGIASILLFLGLWQVGAGFAGSRLLPSPVAVLYSMASEAQDGALLYHLEITLARVAVSFVVARSSGWLLASHSAAFCGSTDGSIPGLLSSSTCLHSSSSSWLISGSAWWKRRFL